MGTLFLNRRLSFFGVAVICMALSGCGTFDMLNVSGDATIGGTVNTDSVTSVSPMSLVVGGDTRIFVDAATGNVGIGNETPIFTLDVAGTGRFAGTVFADAFSSNSPLLLQTNSTTRVFVSDSTGNVGIGTQTPTQLLQVAGLGLFDSGLIADSLASRANNTNLELRTGGTARVFIDSTGDVAVGHTAPLSRLDVRGTIRSSTVNGSEINALSISTGGTVADLTYSSSVGGSTTVSTKVRFDLATARFFGDTGLGRAPTTNRLEVAGNASKDAAGDWLANSDARIKTDIKTVDQALETLDRVRLVSFRYTDSYRAANPSLTERPYLNVIAQEFREIFPDYVHTSNDTLPDGERILQVDTYPLTIYTAAAVQELHQRLKDRDAEISALNEKLNELAARLEALEAAR